jgi:secreted PhoX family phosphatase
MGEVMAKVSGPTDQSVQQDSRGLTRRGLLGGAAGALGIAVTGTLAPLARAGGAEVAATAGDGIGYGPLIDDPAGLLSLPKRFHYTVVAETGVTRLESGQVSPDNYDGTAAFRRPGGGTVLVTNHEIRPPTAGNPNPIGVPHVPDFVYDPGVHGGTTTIEVDDENRRLVEYVSLAGSSTNCAGGRTPWGTWLSCEETFAPAGATLPHGYVFEVDPYDQEANKHPEPIIALGRFEHEAVAVDPDTGQIYETEDANNPHGLLYRWTPPDSAVPLGKGVLRSLAPDAGVLEAMKAFDSNGDFVPDLCVAVEPGTTYDVTWVAVPNRNPASMFVRRQFNGVWNGAPFTDRPGGDITRSRKLEGAWWGDGGAYVVASFARAGDGSAVQHDGQVWFYDPLQSTLELVLRFAYTPDDQDSDPDGPDNISVSPYGGVILAEDGEGRQHLVGATPTGQTYFLARNDVGDGTGELTGPTYSASKATLFANLFSPGRVYAINGPWRRIGRDG